MTRFTQGKVSERNGQPSCRLCKRRGRPAGRSAQGRNASQRTPPWLFKQTVCRRRRDSRSSQTPTWIYPRPYRCQLIGEKYALLFTEMVEPVGIILVEEDFRKKALQTTTLCHSFQLNLGFSKLFWGKYVGLALENLHSL